MSTEPQKCNKCNQWFSTGASSGFKGGRVCPECDTTQNQDGVTYYNKLGAKEQCKLCFGKGKHFGHHGVAKGGSWRNCQGCNGTGEVTRIHNMLDPVLSMTLNLKREEMNALAELAKSKDMSKTATIRQALRLYQVFSEKMKTHELCWRSRADGTVEETIILGCGGE